MTRTERRKGRIATALLGLMVAGCLSANAQSRTDSVQHIDEVIVTGRETDRSIIATVPTQQMDKRLMERLGLTELADAVKKLIGASVKDYVFQPCQVDMTFRKALFSVCLSTKIVGYCSFFTFRAS